MAAIGWAQEFQRVATCTVTEARNVAGRRTSAGTGPTAGHLLLLLCLGRRFRAGVCQDRLLLPVSGQGVAERPRVGQTPSHQGRDRLDRLANGFASCDDPAGLQQICDQLGPVQIQAFFDRWMGRLPLPLTAPTGQAGIGGSCRCGRSRCRARWCSTQPRNGRAFFEALVADNLDLGRPEQIELIFGRKILPSTPGVFATRVVTRGVDVTVNVGYKHSRTKQYFKEGRALRIETVVNDPTDLGCCAAWAICPNSKRKARDVNRRLLDHEHVGQGCVLASPAFERIARPSLVDGRRAPALRFGDPRVQALAGALAITAHLIGGFTNRPLRPLVAGLLGEPYSQARCCYDLRRLRLKGLIVRLEHSNTYVLTEDGQRFAVFYTKVHNRLLRPLMAADQATRPDRGPTGPESPRPGRHRLHRPSPHRRLKSRLKCQTPSDQGSLAWASQGWKRNPVAGSSA